MVFNKIYHIYIRVFRSYNYVGSYKDTSNRALRYGPKAYGYTVETCANACSEYKLFGLQNNGWCQCDNEFTHASKYGASSNECRPLGGPWCNAIYAFTDIPKDIIAPPTVCDGGFPGKDAYGLLYRFIFLIYCVCVD